MSEDYKRDSNHHSHFWQTGRAESSEPRPYDLAKVRATAVLDMKSGHDVHPNAAEVRMTYMAMLRVEQMDEGWDAHKWWSLGQIFSVLQSRHPERLVAPMQEEFMEHLGRA